MTRYLMSVCYSPDVTPPGTDELQSIMAEVGEVHRAASGRRLVGIWWRSHDPSTATVVTTKHGSVLTTDGPFIDSLEVIGGLSIIDVAEHGSPL